MQGDEMLLDKTYQILEQIGSGGSGVIYKAWHKRLEKEVVLKMLRQGSAAKIETQRAEVDILKTLNHTYLPQVYDIIYQQDTVYTVIDYIQGASFDKLLAGGERYSQPEVINWFRQLCEALRYLHGQTPPILHSDIKPANIMLTPAGHICLIDFNIALALGDDGAVAVGRTHGYASPEQYMPFASTLAADKETVTLTEQLAPGSNATVPLSQAGAAPTAPLSDTTPIQLWLDVRSDIYSLGATIYHLLSGVRPATNATEVIPLETLGDFSPDLVTIITKAMAPNPEHRYQTVEDLLEAVNSLHKNDARCLKYKRNRNIATVALVVLFLFSGITSFLGLKQKENLNGALVFSEYSANALTKGDREKAIEYALAGIHTTENSVIPFQMPQTQKALTDALGVYDLQSEYKLYKQVDIGATILSTAIAPDGKHAAVVTAFELVLFNTETGEETERLPVIESALAEVHFVDNETIIYAGKQGVTCYDIVKKQQRWQGKPATALAISDNRSTVITVDKDGPQAFVYDISGNLKKELSFEGRQQKVVENDVFANPSDNLLALSGDGGKAAISFSDGSLIIFDILGDAPFVELMEPSEFSHFEGGFYKQYFAFSATAATRDNSVFAVVDTERIEQTGGFQAEGYFGAFTDSDGIYVFVENLLVSLAPESGEQQEVAYTDSDIVAVAKGSAGVLVATQKGYAVFDQAGNQISSYLSDFPPTSLELAGDTALVANRDAKSILILKYRAPNEEQKLYYDGEYSHDEARVNPAGDRILLFSFMGFRLYDGENTLLAEVEIPDMMKVYDQQYSPESGNLAVIYPDALRIYSGQDGSLLLEETGLKSTFYAPYGISILTADGTAALIDLDTTQRLESQPVAGEFAAFCGRVVDSKFLGNKQLIGAHRQGETYYFAMSDEVQGEVYNQNGEKLFDFIDDGISEAFFAGESMILSPMHGTPALYNVKTGKKIAVLEKDCYLTYATKVDEFLVCEYISSAGEQFGVIIIEKTGEVVATLPSLANVLGETLLFDYHQGYVVTEKIHSLEELLQRSEHV